VHGSRHLSNEESHRDARGGGPRGELALFAVDVVGARAGAVEPLRCGPAHHLSLGPSASAAASAAAGAAAGGGAKGAPPALPVAMAGLGPCVLGRQTLEPVLRHWRGYAGGRFGELWIERRPYRGYS